MTHVMTQKQWRLFAGRGGGGWVVLRFLTNFEAQRSYAVTGMGGGTYYFTEGDHDDRGWFSTLKSGLVADREVINWHGRKPETEAEIFVSWALVKQWTRTVPESVLDEAEALLAERKAIQDTYPPAYPSIGRQYGWDMRPRASDEQCAIDRAELAALHVERDKQVEVYQEAMAEHDKKVKAFCQGLAPTALDDAILSLRAA